MKTNATFSVKPKHFLWFAILTLVLTSCAESVPIEILSEKEPYTFLNGLWHGIISPVTFVISLFKEDVAMYAINNNGAWYNLGFLLGASMTLGGSSKASCSSRKKC